MTSSETIALAESDFNSAPEAPTELSASRTAGSTTITLSWTDASTNETGFEIQYSDDDGSTWNDLTTDLAAGSASYDDEGLTRGTTRSYQVRAVNSFGESAYSDATAAITVPYLLTYNGNNATGGSAPADPAEYEEGATVTVLGNTGTLERTDYYFARWNTEADGSGTSYAPGATFTMGTENVTLYAVWGEIYAIGDTGPAGGWIFYDDEADGVDDIADARYLEAAPSDIDVDGTTVFVWGGYGTMVGGTGKAIGTGEANTAAIVAAYGASDPYNSTGNYAARLCDLYEYGGYDDWFLPSKDELDLMYDNLHSQTLGGFSSNAYWCSYESAAGYAHAQFFSNGTQGSGTKSSSIHVRACRAF